MTDRLGVLAGVKFVLDVLPRGTRHVLGGPCEDIPILTEEVDELAFLFAVEAGAYVNVLAAAGVFWVELHFLVGERSNFKKFPTHTQDHGDA